MWQGTFGFHKMRGMFLVAENLLASQEGLCSMEKLSLINSTYSFGKKIIAHRKCVLIFSTGFA